MATKRKPAASRSKAAKTAKKSPARPKASAKASAPKSKVRPSAKAQKPAKPAKVMMTKPIKQTKPTKPAKPEKPIKAIKVVKPIKGKTKMATKQPAVVRPIGALPPEAVARAVQKAPPPMIRPGRPAPKPVREPAAGALPGVSEKDFKEFEARLLAERQKILKEMGHLENTVLKVNQRDSAGDLSGYSFHMADVGTDAMEREKAFLFASAEGALLREIDEALRKVYRGEYGVCENCGRSIARARLEAMPYARLCLSCKETEERAGRGSA